LFKFSIFGEYSQIVYNDNLPCCNTHSYFWFSRLFGLFVSKLGTNKKIHIQTSDLDPSTAFPTHSWSSTFDPINLKIISDYSEW
jgi:hypothetical protein